MSETSGPSTDRAFSRLVDVALDELASELEAHLDIDGLLKLREIGQ